MKNINIQWRLIFIGMIIFNVNTSAQNVITIPSNRHIPEFYYDNEEIKKLVARLDSLIENGVSVERLQGAGTQEEVYHTWGSEKNIRVLEDRIEFIKNDKVASVPFKLIINDVKYGAFYGKTRIYLGNFNISAKGKVPGQKLKNEFELLIEKNKNLYYENRNSHLVLFEKNAAQYRALKVKPPVSEDQRKLIVQANAFNEKKMYNEAIRLYEQAIEVDQTVYPAAYSNLALLSAQVKRYEDAIYHMKKYLLLVPDAPDARGAQDKIYEWEALMAK